MIERSEPFSQDKTQRKLKHITLSERNQHEKASYYKESKKNRGCQWLDMGEINKRCIRAFRTVELLSDGHMSSPTCLNPHSVGCNTKSGP